MGGYEAFRRDIKSKAKPPGVETEHESNAWVLELDYALNVDNSH